MPLAMLDVAPLRLLVTENPVFPWFLGALLLWAAGGFIAERVWYWRTKRAISWRETLRSVGVGVLVGGSATLVATLMVPLLELVRPYRVADLSMHRWWHWALAWVITDFAYYWIHRFLHETRIGWAFHAPHHTAKQVTMLDSLRSSWGEQPMGVLAYGVPLVLLGVPPEIAGLFYVFVALYQFGLHTEMPVTFGWLDRVFYTPAAHRVHHSRDRAEADRNYGGFFVLFDRAFGTWLERRPDERPDEYGIPGEERNSLGGVVFGEGVRIARGALRRRSGTAWMRYLMVRDASDPDELSTRASS